MSKRFFPIALIMAVLLWQYPSLAQENKLSKVGFYFDTVVTLTAYVDSISTIDEALMQCARYEALLSKTREGSDVWNLNHAQGEPVLVSDDTIYILNKASEVSRLSSGAFDVTIAPAVALWDFINGMDALPAEERLKDAADKIDYSKITINGNAVTLPKGMSIDLGGVAKGYIADRIAEFLLGKGVKNAILNFGGNVVVMGEKPEGSWKVGVQNPAKPTGEYLLAISAKDTAVVTSGIYERGFDLDGTRYHHLLDPQTGWPVQNELASVTIITRESAMADALSTAAFVLGLEKGAELINGLDQVDAVFITRDNAIYATEGASGMISE